MPDYMLKGPNDQSFKLSVPDGTSEADIGHQIAHMMPAMRLRSAQSVRPFLVSAKKVPLRGGPLEWEKDLSPIWRLWDGSWCVTRAVSWWEWWAAAGAAEVGNVLPAPSPAMFQRKSRPPAQGSTARSIPDPLICMPIRTLRMN